MRHYMATNKKKTICPMCEVGILQFTKKDLIFSYKQRSKKLINENVNICNKCKFEMLSDIDNRRIEKILTDFRHDIDGLLDCDSLREIRESLGFNKQKMAQVLSVNEKTIGRYETGKVTQSVQVDKLYRILKEYPFAVGVINPELQSTPNMQFETQYRPKIEKKNFLSIPDVPDDYTLNHVEVSIAAQNC